MTLLKMSLIASILILLIMVIRIFTINKFPKITFIILWGIVIVRLLIPFSIATDFGAPNIIDKTSSMVADSKITDIITISPKEKANSSLPMYSEKIINEGYLSALSPYILIWFLGMGLMASFFLMTHLRYLKKYKMALPIQNYYIEKWLSKQSKKVEIRQSDRIMSPLTYGLWRPVILLPKTMDYSDESKLKFVLTHELIHIKRFDTLSKWIIVATLCIHWFNPFVWFMYILANRDIELSCDETVVNLCGENSKSLYARTLISMAEKRSKWIPLHSNFSKNSIEERIIAIMKPKKGHVLGVILVIGLVLGTTFISSVNATENRSSLFEYVSIVDDVYKYFENVNDVSNETVINLSKKHRLYIQNTIFTNLQVYAVIGLEKTVLDNPIIKGSVITRDEQTIYELDGKFKEIEQEGDMRYFFYTGKVVETDISGNKKRVTKFENRLESNKLDDQKDMLLNISVNLNGNQYQLQSNVENVSEEILVFHPEISNDEQDFFETVVLSHQGIKIAGLSKQLSNACIEPHFKMAIVRTDDTEINFSYDTRGSISDEEFPMSLSLDWDADTCEFNAYWYLRQWKIDVNEVEALIIDGAIYHVK